MVSYPSLSAKQQQALPSLIKPASRIPELFDDSTHQLWQCHTVDGPMMLKVCNQESVTKSSFWQGMSSLFSVDFPTSLAEIAQVYQQLVQQSPLAIPEHIASDSANPAAFILARLFPGDCVELSSVNNDMVQTLAHHISELHGHQQTTWGAFHQANIAAQHWPTRLQQTLQILVERHPEPIPTEILNNAMQQVARMTTNHFSPIMPDLRWDQFLHQSGQLSALVDLDAVVYGPRELELILLEYLLDKQQADVFMEYYLQTHAEPDLSQVRTPYRLLLFLMNVLGEQDLEKWLRASYWWR